MGGVNRNVLSYYSQQTIQFIKSPNHQPRYHLQNATSSSVITRHEEKNRDRRYIFSFHLALMHRSLPRTPVYIIIMCTSLPRPYPSVHPSADSPLVHTAAAPDPTDVAAARTDVVAGKTDAATGKTDAATGKTGTPTEHPATAHPTSTTCGQPPRRHHTKT